MLKINFLKIFLFINICLAGAFLLQFNSMICTNYDLHQHEGRINKLSEGNEKLGFSFLNKNRFENLENLAGELGFKQAEQVEYIEVLSGEVASRPR